MLDELDIPQVTADQLTNALETMQKGKDADKDKITTISLERRWADRFLKKTGQPVYAILIHADRTRIIEGR